MPVKDSLTNGKEIYLDEIIIMKKFNKILKHALYSLRLRFEEIFLLWKYIL